jgi:oxygen-dependent protoporphyrinogen oxidase
MLAKAREARRARKDASAVLDKAAPTRRRLCSFRSGMAALPATLAARMGEDLQTGCGRLTVTRDELKAFWVEFERSGDHHRFICSQVVIATPANVASKLIASISDELSHLLAEINYPPLAIVSLAYDESAIETTLDGFGFLVPPGEQMNVLGCVWNSSLFEGRAPKGKCLVTVFVGGARSPALARLPDADLVATAHGELRKVLGIAGEPHAVAITRYDRSIPQYNLGHAERVRKIETRLLETPGLSIIGNYLHGVSTGDCIKGADHIARQIAESVNPIG